MIPTTTYTYDNNGNTISKNVNGVSTTYSYNNFNQQTSVTSDGKTAQYAYNTQGIRTVKAVDGSVTKFYLDGGNVVGETTGTQTVSYLRGLNLIHNGSSYYLFNAHADVVNLTNASGTVTKTYSYDAFGVEKNPSKTDTNHFRYRGEYWDAETETYYLRARYYDPALGRFTQQDTHWNTANMIYGDNPQKINEREDRLGLKSYSFAPQISAILQSGNLYVYCVNNPVKYADANGNFALTAALLGLIIGGSALLFSGCTTNNGNDSNDMCNYIYGDGYSNYDDAVFAACDMVHNTAIENNNNSEYGCYIYTLKIDEKDSPQYYISLVQKSDIRVVSDSKHQISIKVPGNGWNDDQKLVAIIHSHPWHNKEVIYQTSEFDDICKDTNSPYFGSSSYVVDSCGCIYVLTPSAKNYLDYQKLR